MSLKKNLKINKKVLRGEISEKNPRPASLTTPLSFQNSCKIARILEKIFQSWNGDDFQPIFVRKLAEKWSKMAYFGHFRVRNTSRKIVKKQAYGDEFQRA